jgi:hypothetical protein
MFRYKILFTVIILFSFKQVFSQQLSEILAYRLSQMPLKCIQQEWPNKTSHMSDAETDHRLLPSELHPTFFGCLDWHSSVHGHWLLVKILETFSDIINRDSIIALLDNSFRKEKIVQEAEYFSKYTGSSTYERTYGWAWLLKLDEELLKWNHPKAKEWRTNLTPLTQKIVTLWKNYLPKQTYPNRTGVHPNTAFGLAFAWDWARAVTDTAFENQIVEKAKIFYADNRKIPAYLEPDGSDFFSPSLLAADLMRRIYSPKTFTRWFNRYYNRQSLSRVLELPVVSDRNDYQIVHLDGLAFSRAWCLKSIAAHLYCQPAKTKILKSTAEHFINSALPNITHDNYGGSHWLASFAVYALQ